MNRNIMIINKVRKWLKESGRTYQSLAEEIGVSKSLMGHILTNKRQFTPERMIDVAKAMGVTIQDLISPEQTEEKPYSFQLRGSADSLNAKEDIRKMMFAIEDYLRIERANFSKEV